MNPSIIRPETEALELYTIPVLSDIRHGFPRCLQQTPE